VVSTPKAETVNIPISTDLAERTDAMVIAGRAQFSLLRQRNCIRRLGVAGDLVFVGGTEDGHNYLGYSSVKRPLFWVFLGYSSIFLGSLLDRIPLFSITSWVRIRIHYESFLQRRGPPSSLSLAGPQFIVDHEDGRALAGKNVSHWSCSRNCRNLCVTGVPSRL